jgi:uncharacterized protein (DUF779 family)
VAVIVLLVDTESLPSLQDPQIVLTDAARDILDRVKAERRVQLALVIGNGCCDSTAPFLFANYMAGPNERLVGRVAEVSVFLDESLARSFAGTEVVVDAREDPQPDSFSCEAELGYRFCLERMPTADRP